MLPEYQPKNIKFISQDQANFTSEKCETKNIINADKKDLVESESEMENNGIQAYLLPKANILNIITAAVNKRNVYLIYLSLL